MKFSAGMTPAAVEHFLASHHMEHILTHDDMAAYHAPQQHAHTEGPRCTVTTRSVRKSPSRAPELNRSGFAAQQDMLEPPASRGKTPEGNAPAEGACSKDVAAEGGCTSSTNGTRVLPSGLTLLPSPAENERQWSVLLRRVHSSESNACTEEALTPQESPDLLTKPTVTSKGLGVSQGDGRQDVDASTCGDTLQGGQLGAVWPEGRATVRKNEAGADALRFGTTLSEEADENEIISNFLERTGEQPLCS
jgi:hypothetical protein